MNNLNNGNFGDFGGHLPSELEAVLKTLAIEYARLRKDNNFQKELKHMYKVYANRPSPLYFAKNMTKDLGGPKMLLKEKT